MSDFMNQLLGDDPPDFSSITFDERDAQAMQADIMRCGFTVEMPIKHKVARNLKEEDMILNKIETYSVKYDMTDAQKEYLQQECQFLRFRFESTQKHDHPVSHIFTDINERQVIESYKGERFIDVFGNTSRNRAYKVNSVCYFACNTAKDYLRKLHMKDYVPFVSHKQMVAENPSVKKYFSMHGLYYMSIEDVATIVYSGEDVTLDAVIHVHDKMSGKINRDCSYVVDVNGYVTQTTPLGETYSHPTALPYLKQYEAMTSRGVVAWTATRLLGDSVKITFVACRGYQPNYKVKELELPASSLPKVHVSKREGSVFTMNTLFGYQWLSCDRNGEVVLTDMELLDDLKRYASALTRDELGYKNLSQYCRRLCDKKDLFAKHSDTTHDVPPKMMPWYVCAAFYEGIDNENDAMLTYRRRYSDSLSLHQKLKADLTYKDTTIMGQIDKNVRTMNKIASTVVQPISNAADRSSAAVTNTLLSAIGATVKMSVDENVSADALMDTAYRIHKNRVGLKIT